MGSFITNFQSPVGIDDLVERFEVGQSNIDILFASAIDGWTEWTVAKDAEIGDTVFFMCAKTSKDHIRAGVNEAKRLGNRDLILFAEEQKEKYYRYHGKILAIGKVVDQPRQDVSEFEYQYWRSPWYARIEQIEILEKPVDISDFRDFITVSRTGAITKLTVEQEEKLLQLIDQ